MGDAGEENVVDVGESLFVQVFLQHSRLAPPASFRTPIRNPIGQPLGSILDPPG